MSTGVIPLWCKVLGWALKIALVLLVFWLGYVLGFKEGMAYMFDQIVPEMCSQLEDMGTWSRGPFVDT